MPFQIIKIAMRKRTGSALSKLLLIYLTDICELTPAEELGGSGPHSQPIDFNEELAADFCQCTIDEIYPALRELERLRLVWPDEQWVWNRVFDNPDRGRWEYLVVALPMSSWAASDRRRFKASDDEMARLQGEARWRCSLCRKGEDEIAEWAVDHVIPRSVGGADVEENCQAICSKCNMRKGARVHWLDFIGGRA